MSSRERRCTLVLTGDTIIHKCARLNEAASIERIATTSSVDSRNNRGETPVIVAAQTSSIRAVNKLIELGCNVNLQDATGNTALHYAVTTSSERAVDALVTAGADVNIANNQGKTPIHWLALSNCTRLGFLLNKSLHKMDLLKVDENGWDPFITAVVHNSGKIINFFIREGYLALTQVTSAETPLHIALQLNNFPMIKGLANSQFTNVPNKFGHTPLAVAVLLQNELAVELLWTAGAKSAGVDHEGNTILHLACRGTSIHLVNHFLVQTGGICDVRNFNMETPLHIACMRGTGKIVRNLCRQGADSTAQDIQLRTPLMAAILAGNSETALMLLNWEFITNVDPLTRIDMFGYTAKDYCLMYNVQVVTARISTIEKDLHDIALAAAARTGLGITP